MTGKVFIVGGGVGDKDYITLKGYRLLQSANAVVYDRLIPRGLLDYANPTAELFYVGKSPGSHSMNQGEINDLLLDLSGRFNIVVRLKGGDPLIFGRGEEECEYLIRKGINCKIIPGITSYSATAAKFIIPLAGRNYTSSFTVATGHLAEEKKIELDYSKLAETPGTLVLLMAASKAKQILKQVMEVRGVDEHAMIIQRLGMEDESILCGRLMDLTEKVETAIENPAVIFIGKSVELGVKLGKLQCL
ncbi:MAG: uroporphyrinogen-III C-methyltransferase [Desulfurococcales archaeon]|nr:uroporphyrinogen-III C-methyltransferase [Desulfurococcales archaeon]